MKNFGDHNRPCRLLLVLTCAALIPGCANFEGSDKPAAVPEIRPGLLMGYLPQNPDSLTLLPAFPAPDSAACALDEEIANRSIALRDSPRWKQAILDADLNLDTENPFSCTLGVPITKDNTPHLHMLLSRTLTDVSRSTRSAKEHYNRARPFEVNKEPICTPEKKTGLEKDGSYPSGHAATGWAWALILAEIEPEQTNAILARGRAYGESRNVCNVHWRSDVIEGRFMGAATVARLHADPTFRADLDAVRAEIEDARAKGLKPTRDCKAETAALAQQWPLTKSNLTSGCGVQRRSTPAEQKY